MSIVNDGDSSSKNNVLFQQSFSMTAIKDQQSIDSNKIINNNNEASAGQVLVVESSSYNNKSTQIDTPPIFLGRRTTIRPMSLSQLSFGQQQQQQQQQQHHHHHHHHRHHSSSSSSNNPSNNFNHHYGFAPPLVSQSYTAIDMMSHRYDQPMSSTNNLSSSGLLMPLSASCNCCCCGYGQFNGPAGSNVGQPTPPSSHSNPEQQNDGPEGLSWRRLHMSRAKLKATATTSELLSGFAMVAMVELQINEPTAVPEWLFVIFAVCTTVLVSVHIFALMISTYLLPNIEAISKLQSSKLITESPHERMRGFIELAWVFSTILGLFLFLVEIAILCWVKFWDYSVPAATASTIIVIPVLIVFIAFAVYFYHSLVVYKCETSVTDLKELENIKRNLDNASVGV